ncbi:glycosyltransferase [Altibacter sp. HG106]|uniref:glycosyltransferase n=1 Tax=Altibacter sp. HG106 TaxID=3023937 RepID=UPI00235015A6|nr:glycosyltransferase [Altibacter sp. HG106]MDC7996131.1 glycosyltransferase [Altibacter sp. HG106]
MKILLIGEYSRLHNSLKEGLQELGHEVCLVATGDYFKKFPADILLTPKYQEGWGHRWKVFVYRCFGIDLRSKNLSKQLKQHAAALKGYDVVQLINECPMGMQPKDFLPWVSFFKEHNRSLFLLSCGTDHLSVKYAFQKKFRYSILTPYFEGKVSEKAMAPALKYLSEAHEKHYQKVVKQVDGVIASDLDYHIPWKGHPKYLGMVPNPVNVEKLAFSFPTSLEPIVIFHGINRGNYFKKGNDLFEAALDRLRVKNLPIEIVTVENLPYTEYIMKYRKAHILLDQVYAYDQGYNALEAMAQGKVVLTGAEHEWRDYYGLAEHTVVVNALPDVDALCDTLQQLIASPQQLEHTAKQARKFIEQEHHYVRSAERYLWLWQQRSDN